MNLKNKSDKLKLKINPGAGKAKDGKWTGGKDYVPTSIRYPIVRQKAIYAVQDDEGKTHLIREDDTGISQVTAAPKNLSAE